MHNGGREASGDDDAGLFALKFLGGGELATQEFEEAAGARAAIAAKKSHAVEKNQQLEDVGILDGGGGGFRGVLFDFGEIGGKGGVEFALDGEDRRLFVKDAGREGFVGVGEGFDGGEGVGIGSGGLRGTEFCDGEGYGGKKLLMGVNEFLGKADVEERRVGGQIALMLIFIAMSGDQVGAVGGTVDGDFPLGAATDGTDFFGFGGTETFGFAFLADWTGHVESSGC
jgi:hypothetical protein